MVNYVELKIFNFDFALKHAQPVYSNSLPIKKKAFRAGATVHRQKEALECLSEHSVFCALRAE